MNKAACYEALHQAAREMAAAEHAVQEAFVRTGNRWFTPGIPPALERRAKAMAEMDVALANLKESGG